jgi:hypothetical protein
MGAVSRVPEALVIGYFQCESLSEVPPLSGQGGGIGSCGPPVVALPAPKYRRGAWATGLWIGCGGALIYPRQIVIVSCFLNPAITAV